MVLLMCVLSLCTLIIEANKISLYLSIGNLMTLMLFNNISFVQKQRQN